MQQQLHKLCRTSVHTAVEVASDAFASAKEFLISTSVSSIYLLHHVSTSAPSLRALHCKVALGLR
jgi:hypothetical protein